LMADAQNTAAGSNPANGTPAAPLAKVQFPYVNQQSRLNRYNQNDQLFEGAHFLAFANMARSTDFKNDYERLRYVIANFAGLISKVAADMLFGEELKIVMPDKNQQAFMDALIHDNSLHTLFYESALENSRRGDAVFKIRIQDNRLIWDTVNPSVYFPRLDPNNVTGEPLAHELAWVTTLDNGRQYVRKEIHTKGLITNELWEYGNHEIGARAVWSQHFPNQPEVESTGIDRSLIIHVPNFRDRSRFFGFDDYTDLHPLMFALNNRLTKNENVLDKHSDPILAVPEGVLDENGKIKKEALQMFEMVPDPETGADPVKPEYIVWNASLDNSFKQIDKLVDFLYMFSETSPDAFGMGKNAVTSGRALKLLLMRTIAKVNRKRIYYNRAIKEAAFVSQLMAKKYGVSVMGVNMTGEAIIPELEWSDGLPTDSFEAAQEEQMRVASGNTSTVDSIMRLDKVDRDTAIKRAQEIRDQDRVDPGTGGPKLTLPGDPAEAVAAVASPELSLNGAQLASLLDVIAQVAAGQLPRKSGIEIISTSFSLAPEKAESIMGAVGTPAFKPAASAEG
jgi:hypothetical protein